MVSTYLMNQQKVIIISKKIENSEDSEGTYVGYLLHISLDNCGRSNATKSRLHCLLKCKTSISGRLGILFRVIEGGRLLIDLVSVVNKLTRRVKIVTEITLVT